MSTALSNTALSNVVRSTHWPSRTRPAAAEFPEIPVTPNVRAVLMACFDAYAYARNLDRNLWDFAIEISTLRRMGLSRSDLRWVVGKGLLESAIETSLPGDAERSFRRPPRLVFCKNTCFVLTQDCAKLASKCFDRSDCGAKGSARTSTIPTCPKISTEFKPPELKPLVPQWDRDRQILRIGQAVVKQFKVPAASQEIVLAAFEEEGWPARIDDPLPPNRELAPKKRLRETIKSLNRNQKQSLIRFLGDGSGEGIRWEFVGENQLAF